MHRVEWERKQWVLVTLTLPGQLALCDYDPGYLKKALQAFLKRMNRDSGRRLDYFWKMEYQRRGACHFHLVLELTTDVARMRAEVASAWHELVGRGQRDHLVAGTSVERAFSSSRIASYLVKEMGGAASKEYQHQLPREMAAAGRWWAHSRGLPQPWSLTILRYTAAYRMRRVASRLSKSERHRAQMERARRRWLGRTDLYTGPPARSLLSRLAALC